MGFRATITDVKDRSGEGGTRRPTSDGFLKGPSGLEFDRVSGRGISRGITRDESKGSACAALT